MFLLPLCFYLLLYTFPHLSHLSSLLPPSSLLPAALKRMLNLNQPLPRGAVAASEPVWKVLVYDKFGSDIISPLLSVRELRQLGVTLHLSAILSLSLFLTYFLPLFSLSLQRTIDAPREQIPDAVAIYFLLPTEENIKSVCRDLQNQLYDKCYLNFLTAISRPLLEDLAKACLEANCVTHVAKVTYTPNFYRSTPSCCLGRDG